MNIKMNKMHVCAIYGFVKQLKMNNQYLYIIRIDGFGAYVRMVFCWFVCFVNGFKRDFAEKLAGMFFLTLFMGTLIVIPMAKSFQLGYSNFQFHNKNWIFVHTHSRLRWDDLFSFLQIYLFIWLRFSSALFTY